MNESHDLAECYVFCAVDIYVLLCLPWAVTSLDSRKCYALS